MKTIWWSFDPKVKKNGYFIVEFWSKPDRSNVLKLKVISPNDEHVRRQIEDELGIKKFDLKYERDK